MTIDNKNSENITQTLGLGPKATGRRGIRFWSIVIAGLALLAALAVFITHKEDTGIQFKTAEAEQGNLTVIVSATGNLEPTNQVDVGTEVSGTVESVTVDYNDVVKAGQILAKIDTTKLEAQVRQSRAAVESAQANLTQAQASVLEANNDLERLKHVRELSKGKVPSVQDMDAAETSLKRAEADEAKAKANISESEAQLMVDETDLSKATIRSPINGVVLVRSVEPGQTVAASLQAPVLFTLAEDLTKMELHVDVDEADVGQVKQGQKATFTVDAYPGITFPAQITQVRYGSKTVAGVVTYETVLTVNNSSLLLRPGMTATADITVKQINDAILIPDTALRFSPPQKKTKATSAGGGSLLSKLFRRPPRNNLRKREIATSDKILHRIWTLRDGQPAPIDVTIGATDGIKTVVMKGDVTPGMPLILEMIGKEE